jgi:hypothetical protein
MNAAEAFGPAIVFDALAANQRMVELDFRLNPEAAGIGAEFGIGVADRDPNGLEHADIAARRGERLDAGAVDGGDEGRRAAVHDRRLGAVDLHHCVVHAEPAQRSHDVLGGGHQWARSISQDSGKFGCGHRPDVGEDFTVAARQAGADETGQDGLIAKRGLPASPHTPSHFTRLPSAQARDRSTARHRCAALLPSVGT